MSPANEPLSFSRLTRWAQCRRSYQLHYLEKSPSTAGAPLRLGTLLHVPLERVYKWIISEQYTGKFPEDWLVDALKEEWPRSGFTEFAVFEEALDILRAYSRRHAMVDYRTVLAVEQEFLLPLGRFQVLGYIDRVDRIDDATIEILDYKSNRLLFTREDVDHSLQLSIYMLAARHLWPWAKSIRLGFDLLRHGIHMATSRTEEQLDAARHYISMLGEQIATGSEFPATLNENCVYCDHRAQCVTYHRALLGKIEFLCNDESDLEAVAREREEVARTAKILYARKDELERILKKRLEDVDHLDLGGMVYTLGKATQLAYPTAPTLSLFRDLLGKADDDLLPLLISVDKVKVDALVKELAKSKSTAEVKLMKARLDAIAEKTVSPRFNAQRAKAPGGAA